MQNYSLFEKIGILFSIIKTSPLFIVSFIIGIILITMMFLDLKTTKKIIITNIFAKRWRVG